MDFLDFIRKVHEERKARGLVIKGGPGSGWFAPPKGTHVARGKEKKPKTLPGEAKPMRGYGKPHNIYVLRMTPNVEGDIERGWSGWMGVRDESLEELLTYYLDVDSDDLEEKWEKWQDPEHATWYRRDYDDYQAFLEDYAEKHGLNVKQDPVTGEWVSVHHEGLAAFLLTAQSSKAAIAEAQKWLSSENPPGSGGWWGVATSGKVEPVANLGDNWYILGAEGSEETGF